MCGILGSINYIKLDFKKAKEILNHRGPDDNGEYIFENLFLYNARLSIQDIKNGHQPFLFNDFAIIFNGEIYNHLALRKRFDLDCKTSSDTETLLLLYIKIGKECLHYLDGMFAFAIFNKCTKKLFIARDRAGEKPLYIYSKNDLFIFGSELNAVVSPRRPEINYNNFYQYLRYSFIDSSTPYTDVLELPAGSWLEIDITTLRKNTEKWWKIEEIYQNKSILSEIETLNTIDKYLNESVFNRLNTSDLEVGTFLSGGIDSGLVTAIASKFKNKLKTFTIVFDGQYDESALAGLVAKKFSTDHIKIPISFSDLKKDLIKILTNYGEPYADSSAIPSYYVAREAKKHLTVILNGDGADELFGGYRRYVPFSHFDFFTTKKWLKSISRNVAIILPFPDNKLSKFNYLYRLADFSSKDPIFCYLSATTDVFEGYESNFNSSLNPFDDMGHYLDIITSKKFSGLEKIMCMDFKFLFANDLLVKMDIATMAHSLEGRTPFLSKDLLEFAPTIDDKFKIRGFKTKYLLRELAKKYLPEELINQPKRGFEIPLKSWMENDLKEITFDYLSGSTFSETFIKRQFILELLNNKTNTSPEKRAKMLWSLLALEIWFKHCYNNL
jgi:asparagine synthase (glutamine-hydrolysing)